MINDFLVAGGRIVIREFDDRRQVLALDEPVIFNCTGLGARELFKDYTLFPIRGQLSFLLPQREVDYIILGNGGLYMFPRSDGILLGGTFEYNQYQAVPDPVATNRIINGHRDFFNAMADPWA